MTPLRRDRQGGLDLREGRAAVLAGHYVQAGALAPAGRAVNALIAAGGEAAAVLAWEQVPGHWRERIQHARTAL